MNTAYRNKDDAYKKKIDVRGGGDTLSGVYFLCTIIYTNRIRDSCVHFVI